MLNLKMTAKAMPHADDVDARREEFEAFTARAVAQAVKAIGQGLDVRAEVLIAASYAIATQPLRNVISAQAFDKSTKATTTKEIKSAILVGLVMDGRPVFKGLPAVMFSHNDAQEALDEFQIEKAIATAYASGARYLNSIASFLNDATKLAALVRKPANSGLFTLTLSKPTEKACFAAYQTFAAPLASEIMMERKKIAAAKAKKEISVSNRIAAYLEKQTDMTALDCASIIALLTETHNALLAQEAAVLERAKAVPEENEEIEADDARIAA
jgi:hypothetical protein